MQPLPDFSRAVASVVIAAKVARVNTTEDGTRSFDMDVSQYAREPHQTTRLRCYYPNGYLRLQNTPLPSVGKYVIVSGEFVGMDKERCIVNVKDISFGPPTESAVPFTASDGPSMKVKGFDWGRGKGGKGQGKRARLTDENEEKHESVASSSNTAAST